MGRKEILKMLIDKIRGETNVTWEEITHMANLDIHPDTQRKGCLAQKWASDLNMLRSSPDEPEGVDYPPEDKKCGTNGRISHDDTDEAKDILEDARIVLCQTRDERNAMNAQRRVAARAERNMQILEEELRKIGRERYVPIEVDVSELDGNPCSLAIMVNGMSRDELLRQSLETYFTILRGGRHMSGKENIKVKYFDNETDKLTKIDKGDWIDLRAAETVELQPGDFALIPLGVGMILPDGYEAHVVPRSSAFKNYGIIQTNSMGVIDNSYCGENDQWHFPAYATRATTIHKNDRICQFRIQKKQPEISFEEVEHLKADSRGGFGSTGISS